MEQNATKRQRSCIGCGVKSEKMTLHRIVRTSDGSVAFDHTGRVSGRGAYVCSSACFAAAQKNRKLDRALRIKLTDQDYERIAAALNQSAEVGEHGTEE